VRDGERVQIKERLTMKNEKASAKKRILSVSIKRMIDESPDTSWLGEYSNKATSEFSIDRAHSLDCASQTYNSQTAQAKQTLEHVQQTIGDMQTALPSRKDDERFVEDRQEWEALEDAYNEVGELLDSVSECDCGEHGDQERNQYRYFNPSFNYVDKNGHTLPENTAEEVRKYVRQDYERMESANRGDFCYLVVGAEARIQTSPSGPTQKISAGWVGGIESDQPKSEFDSLESECLSDLKSELKSLGFSTRAISAAFKSIEREDACWR
jgi:hypothetical protein